MIHEATNAGDTVVKSVGASAAMRTGIVHVEMTLIIIWLWSVFLELRGKSELVSEDGRTYIVFSRATYRIDFDVSFKFSGARNSHFEPHLILHPSSSSIKYNALNFFEKQVSKRKDGPCARPPFAGA